MIVTCKVFFTSLASLMGLTYPAAARCGKGHALASHVREQIEKLLECNGSVVTRDRGASLRCVLEQDTLILA